MVTTLNCPLWISDYSGARSRRKTAPQRLPAIPSGGVSSHVSPCVLRVVPPAAAMIRWQSTIHAGYTHHATSVMCFSPAFYPTASDDSCRRNGACCVHDASFHVAVDYWCRGSTFSRIPCVLRVVPPTAAMLRWQSTSHAEDTLHAACVMCFPTSLTISDGNRRLMRQKLIEHDVLFHVAVPCCCRGTMVGTVR